METMFLNGMMIKVRRYGKTIIVKFENGKWIQVDSSTIVHEGYGFFSFKNWFIPFFGKIFPHIKTPQFN